MSPRPSLRPLAGLVLRTQPDFRLVTLFREGHECAFEEIVRRYRSALVGFAGGIVPRHQADDVVQESLVRAHAALGGENEIEIRPWLYTIVRNRALNAVRDEHAHERISEDYDGVPQPPDVLGRKEEVAALVAKLKALPEMQRQAIVKRELEGRSHEEIALAMGATPGAVRGLIFRAREGLRTVGGFVFPSTLVDALLGSPGTTGAIGGVAAGGGAGLLLKAGVAVTVGALAVGSGIAIQDRSKPHESIRIAQSPRGHAGAREAAVVALAAHRGAAGSAATSGDSAHRPSSGGDGSSGTNNESSNSGPGGSGGGSTASSSGSDRSGSESGGETHSGDGGGGSSGSDDGGGSGSGGGTTSDDGGGSGTDDGGTSGGGSNSGPGGGGDDATSGGGSGSGSDGSGDGSSGSGDGGSGSGETTTTPTTTTPDGGGDVVTPPPGDD
jgi:RNA polymerase sigma factor (sigma-70 family)